jgi:hypothetical protein
VSELLLKGAVTDQAKAGLTFLHALPPMDAWWRAVDVLARSVLPRTLAALPDRFSSERLRRDARPLVDLAARLEAVAPLPQSVEEVATLLRAARPFTHSKFLSSFEMALSRPGDAFPGGALCMALARWPGVTSSGHHLDGAGEREASCAALEALVSEAG